MYVCSTLVFILIGIYLGLGIGDAGISHPPRRGCPMAAFTGHCLSASVTNICTNDTECAPNQFCCEIDCFGADCLEPKLKNGSCGEAEIESWAVCMEEDEVRCKTDMDCSGHSICCRTPCAGSICKGNGTETTETTKASSGSYTNTRSHLYTTTTITATVTIFLFN